MSETTNPESVWDIYGLPEEFKVFTAEAAVVGARIAKDNPLLEPGLENLTRIDAQIIAQAGARVAVAALVESGALGPDAVEKVRSGHEIDDVTVYMVPADMQENLRIIEERTNN